MINKYNPHLVVLFEDKAYRDIYNGFRLNANINLGVLHGMRLSNGWHKVVDDFVDEYINYLRQWQNANLLMLIDFDDDAERAETIKNDKIPLDLQNRVFILGSLIEAENLRPDFGRNYEKLGKCLAKDCVDGTMDAWGHPLLQHNADRNLQRLITSVKPFLFRT
jgi:hypothetical protein